jgi:hypothetical protein
MPEVPRQRGAAAVARTGLQPGHLPALHRAARGDGRLVADQPATQADQDRGTRRAPRPRHHLPVGRGGRHRPDGARHPRRHPPIASATVMRMTAIHAKLNESGRTGLSAALKNTAPGQDTAASRSDPPCSSSLRDPRRRSGRKTLVQRSDSGDLHVRRHATWGMSVYRCLSLQIAADL